MMKSLFEQNDGTYSNIGDYSIPNLILPDKSEYYIGNWGRLRLDYLKQYRHILYINLLTSGKLTDHLHDIDAAALELQATIAQQMAATLGVTEQLKEENQYFG